ncbi:MAG: LemA family protein [Candidatus Micrarchaeota archaeon]|nr:LemA family protein [Candidatus Micrarchaeota archaeon]
METSKALIPAFAVFGLYSYYSGMKDLELLKKIEYTPTCKAISVYPGLVEIQGKAARGERLLESPVGKKPCVFYAVFTYKFEQKRKKGEQMEIVGITTSEQRFYIEDETGRVAIDPRGLECKLNYMKVDKKIRVNMLSGRKSTLEQTKTALEELRKAQGGKISGGIAEKIIEMQQALASAEVEEEKKAVEFIKTYYPHLSQYHGDIEINEILVQEGDEIYLLGEAKVDEEEKGDNMIICSQKGKPFYISDGSEREAVKKLKSSALFKIVFMPLFFGALMLLFASNELPGHFVEIATIIAAIILLMYAYAILMVLLEMYNGIVVLKMQIERAKSNLQVLLMRRRELLPKLEEVVKESAKHEKELQAAIANVRAYVMDEKIDGLLAILENYPKLKANNNFVEFQRQLKHTEEWIAGGRKFLVDSITLYNTKIEQFPYNLIAKAIKFKPIEINMA